MTRFTGRIGPIPTLNLPREEQTVALEQLVDQIGMHSVLQVLSTIAFYKRDHLRESYQDAATAKVWTKVGIALERVSNAGPVCEVSPP